MDARWWTVLACLVLSGCAGPAETEAGNDTSRATGTVVDDPSGPTPENTNTGIVRGIVINEAGIVIKGALVLILSVESSVSTDANGTFKFPVVEAGKQTVRVEKQNYQTLTQGFTAVAGKAVELEVVLMPVAGIDPGMLDHFHDHWRGADTYTVFEGTVEWETEMGDDPLICQGVIGGDVPYDERGCVYLDVIPEEGRIIPPGTRALELTATYDMGLSGQAPRFYIDPPDYECETGKYCYNLKTMAAPSGESVTLELEPFWTDHGHAESTGWSIALYWANSVGAAGYSYTIPASGWFWNDLAKNPATIKIVAVRGALEIDPPHPRFWQDNDTVELPDVTEYALCLACSSFPRYPTVATRNACEYTCILFPPGSIVPPGATRLDFTFGVEWGGRDAADDLLVNNWMQRFTLGYKTPDIGLQHGTWADFVWPEPVEAEVLEYGQVQRFSIPLHPDHADRWYDTFSQWMFSIAIEGEEEAERMELACKVYSACPYPRFQLSEIRVVNESVAEEP